MSKHSAVPTPRTQFLNTMGKVEYLQNNRWTLTLKAMQLGVPRAAAAKQVHNEIVELIDHAARLAS